MELLQLKYFVYLANKQNLTQTARELMVSPPAISNSIARLEKELEVKLFDRVGRRIELNDYGKVFLRHINSMFISLENGTEELKDMHKNMDSSLIIGTVSPLICKEPLKDFLAKYPHFRIKMVTLDTGVFPLEAPRDLVDLIISPTDSIHAPDWICETIFVDRIMLAVPPKHHLAQRKSINLIEARNEYFINSLHGTAFRHSCDDLCKRAGFEPKSSLECDYRMLPRMLVNENMVCLTTSYARHVGLFDNAVLVKISNPSDIRSQAIFWHKDKYQSRLARIFKEFIIDYYRGFDL